MAKTTPKNNHSEDAYQKIIGGIMNGELKPGMLVSEHTLSQMYDIGRTPIREALKRLEGEGFIINSDRKKRIYELSPEDIREIFDLKIEIEGMVAHKAALCTDEAERKEMQSIMSDIESFSSKLGESDGGGTQEDIRIWLALDSRFHDQLYKMASNSRAKGIIENLNAQWHRIRVGLSAITGHLGTSIKEHQRIGYAVLDKEPEVAEASIKAHFKSLKERIITLMNTFQN